MLIVRYMDYVLVKDVDIARLCVLRMSAFARVARDGVMRGIFLRLGFFSFIYLQERYRTSMLAFWKCLTNDETCIGNDEIQKRFI